MIMRNFLTNFSFSFREQIYYNSEFCKTKSTEMQDPFLGYVTRQRP